MVIEEMAYDVSSCILSATTDNAAAMEMNISQSSQQSMLPQSAVLFSGINFFENNSGSNNANLIDSSCENMCEGELQQAVLPRQETVYHAAVVRLVNLRRRQKAEVVENIAESSPCSLCTYSIDCGCAHETEYIHEQFYYEETPELGEQENEYLETDEEGLNEEEMTDTTPVPKQVKAMKRRQPSELTSCWINKKNGQGSHYRKNYDTSEQAHPTFIPAPWSKTSQLQPTLNRTPSQSTQSHHPSSVDAPNCSSDRKYNQSFAILPTSTNPFYLNNTPNNSSIYQDEDILQAEYRKLHTEVERIGTGTVPLGQQQRRRQRKILTPFSSHISLNQEQSARRGWPEDLGAEDLSARGINNSSSPLQSAERPRRPPIQINLAKGLIDLARGHNSSRSQQQQRKIIQAKLQSSTTNRSISPAHPLNFTHAFVDEAMHPYKFDVVLQMPLPSREEMERHAWNPDDRSLNIYVKEEDRLTLHRHPVAQSTDCIRGKIGYTRGFHVWQLVWPVGQRGTHPLVGVATKECALHATGYNALIGSNTESYGWDMVQNKCYHDSRNTKGWTYPTYPSTSSTDESFQPSDKFYCILDMDEGYMAFATSKQYLGVAFRGLKGKKLYPIVSAVWGHCEITIRYMGGLDPEPRQLMDVCRRTIRLQMGRTRLDRIPELKLPPALMHYLLYKL